jgi:hypothetical protein
MIEYITIIEDIRANGYRHYCNGMKYLERGMTQHARGSFAKAQRNYDKVERMESYHRCLDYINNDFLNKLSENVAASFLGIDFGSGDQTVYYKYYYKNDKPMIYIIDEKDLYG